MSKYSELYIQQSVLIFTGQEYSPRH